MLLTSTQEILAIHWIWNPLAYFSSILLHVRKARPSKEELTQGHRAERWPRLNEDPEVLPLWPSCQHFC